MNNKSIERWSLGEQAVATKASSGNNLATIDAPSTNTFYSQIRDVFIENAPTVIKLEIVCFLA